MPRLAKSAFEKKNSEFRSVVAYYLADKGYPKIRLSKSLGMSYSCFWKKMKSPELFTLQEIRHISSYLNIPSEKLYNII